MVYVNNDDGVVYLEGAICRSNTDIYAVLEDIGQPKPIVADLTVGSWRAFQVAAEFLAQLGSPVQDALLIDHPLPTHTLSEWSYADIIGALVDAETSGDSQILKAFELAERTLEMIMPGSNMLFLILTPVNGTTWNRENYLYTEFLVRGLLDADSRVLLVFKDFQFHNFPTHWKLTLRPQRARPPAELGKFGPLRIVPGIASTDLAMELGDENTGRFELGGGAFFVDLLARVDPGTISQLEFDRLAAAPNIPSWIRAYAHFYGSSIHVQSNDLCHESRRQFASGGFEVALSLVERAVACAKNAADRSIAQTQAQAMRVALMRFMEAAGEPDPSPALPPNVRAFLLQCKGWGLVMLGDAGRAREYLERACVLFSPQSPSREYLYLLNITALSVLKTEGADKALELELKIDEELQRLEHPDWQLLYINSLNIARVYMRKNNPRAASTYFERGFSTTLGLRSESDSIYINVVFARLAEQEGLLGKAFACWLRVALHWLAARVPEAIAPRVARSILGGSSLERPIVEAISAAIHKKLIAAMRTLSISVEPSIDNSLSFTNSNSMDAELCVYDEGLGFLFAKGSIARKNSGTEYNYLRATVSGVLRERLPGITFCNEGTIIVDNQFGSEIPATRSELTGVAIRRGVPQIYLYKPLPAVEKNDLEQLGRRLEVTIGKAVDKLDRTDVSTVVYFKRYLSPLVAVGDRRRLLDTIIVSKAASVGQLLDLGFDIQTIRGLETDRTVELKFSESE